MNNVTLAGRLTKSPEMRRANNEGNTAICTFTLAVDGYRRKDGEENTNYIPIVVFGKTGERAFSLLQKGMMIGIIGELSIKSYKDEAGSWKSYTNVVAREWRFLESKDAFELREQRKAEKNDQPSVPEAGIPSEAMDSFVPAESIQDDIPFESF